MWVTKYTNTLFVYFLKLIRMKRYNTITNKSPFCFCLFDCCDCDCIFNIFFLGGVGEGGSALDKSVPSVRNKGLIIWSRTCHSEPCLHTSCIDRSEQNASLIVHSFRNPSLHVQYKLLPTE